MQDSAAELHLQLQPLGLADQQRVAQTKHAPVQRIKVSQRTSLTTIAGYVQRIAGADPRCFVSLHAPYHTETVQLPLSISVAEFLFITNQRGQGELRYAFSEQAIVPDRQVELHRPPKLRGRKIPELEQPISARYPPPPLVVREKVRTMASPVGGVFYLGLSMFSNSFGCLPHSLNGMTGRGAVARREGGRAHSEDVASLRKHLEAEIGATKVTLP
jgi:hypothetical protein